MTNHVGGSKATLCKEFLSLLERGHGLWWALCKQSTWY